MVDSFTHLRVRMIGKDAILAGRQFSPGEVVALDDLEFKPENWEAVSGTIEATANQHPVVEAGTVGPDGAFVPWASKGKSKAS